MRRVLAVLTLATALFSGASVVPVAAQAPPTPGRPTGVEIVEIDGDVAVTWDDQDDVTGWFVFLRVARTDASGWHPVVAPVFVPKGTTTWSSGLPWATAEVWVAGRDSATVVGGWTWSRTPAPSAPTGVTATRTRTSVRLAWNEYSTFDVPVTIIRRVRRHLAPLWTRTMIQVPPGKRTWSEPAPTDDEVSYEIMRMSVFNQAASTLVAVGAPGEPTNVSTLTACQADVCTYTITWSPLPGATSFRLRYRQLDAAGVWSPFSEMYVTGRRAVITAPRARTAINIAGVAWDGRTIGPRVRVVARPPV